MPHPLKCYYNVYKVWRVDSAEDEAPAGLRAIHNLFFPKNIGLVTPVRYRVYETVLGYYLLRYEHMKRESPRNNKIYCIPCSEDGPKGNL